MLPRIHLISDPLSCDRASLQRVLRATGTWVEAIQVRAKDASDRDVAAWTADLIDAVRPRGVRVILNDRVDVALVAGADGVHLGATDLPVDRVRALAPQGFLIGATCRGVRDAAAARKGGADYVGIGPIWASTTKKGLPDPLGLDVVSRVASVLPAIAIGGVTARRVPAVMAAGAYGVAVVAAVWQAADPPGAAREIAELVRAA